MSDNKGTYDTETAKSCSLDRICEVMRTKGADKIYVKKLSPNDNSKNQPYFGFHLTDISFLPTGSVSASNSLSNKKMPSSRNVKFQAPMKLEWVDIEGRNYPAPNAKLIYYPQYPEVRFSGFLRGSKVSLSHWMSPDKDGRSPNRWLLLGVLKDKTVIAYLATPDSKLSKELEGYNLAPITSIFGIINLLDQHPSGDSKSMLKDKLREISNMGWVPSSKLNKQLERQPYKARNGAGYTLEALLGIYPNGVSEPDFLGWEVKQFSVKQFPSKSAGVTTLLTPEPDGGFYKQLGVNEFVKQYGYPDKSNIPDRLNFGGRHFVGEPCSATYLTMHVDGYDQHTNSITNADGAVQLQDSSGTIAASWSFEKIMDHWKTKHSQAVYVPCLARHTIESTTEYQFGSDIELGTGTTFELLLGALSSRHVYYDPGIKLEGASSDSPKSKRRSQFRIHHKNLGVLYKTYEFLNLKNE